VTAGLAADPWPSTSPSLDTISQTGAVNTVCPVSGHKIGSAGEPACDEYQGKKIALCCKYCVTKFEQNPDKYGTLDLKNETANEAMLMTGKSQKPGGR